MTHEREHATVTDDRTRADVLARLARLADPDIDDLTRSLDAHMALEQLAGPALIVDLDGTILDCNEQVGALGVDREAARGRALWSAPMWEGEDPSATLSPLVDAGAEGRAGQRTVDIGGAAPRPGRVSLTPVFDDKRGVAVLLVELRGLADTRETDALIAATTQALAAAEDIFRAVAEHTSDLVCLHDPTGTFTYVSPSVRRLLDLDPAALAGTHPVDIAHADTRDALVHAVQDAGRRGSEPTRFRHRLRHRNGSFRWFETAITPILAPDGTVRQLQSSSRDITEQRETEQSLIKQAFHDELTGLPNKALLIDRMTHALAASARTGQPIGVLFIDLDGFKTINDTLGHPVGDTALTKVAERLTAIVRPGDTLARIGGDEFLMLCAGTDGARGATAVARRILDAFAQPFVLEGREIAIGASIGIATSLGAEDPAQIIENADTAMYEAKHEGRGRFAIHDEVDQSLALERIDTEEALRRAVTNNELRLHYQPELDLESGRIVGFEALVRWQRPDGRLVPPGEFIPLAEESGIIVDLGRWVIAEACRQASLWRVHRTPEQEPVRIWVNLSARQLGDPDLVPYVERTVEAAGISTDEICLEITESALMDDAQAATEQLDQLRRIGISLGIDDFGTGWSQFAYLQRLPLDVLKIDRSFVSGLASDHAAATIVAAIIDLAHALGLIVIAEGVESEDQLEVLRELDCDQALGFLFSEPREPAAFDSALTEN
ncbi:MAG: EAL domain-containing protein [Acidimicrobiales bacterium]|nr:EAL domain-containing protein [Acidimicrobiales bacterium]